MMQLFSRLLNFGDGVSVNGVNYNTNLPGVDPGHDQLQTILQLTLGVLAAVAVLIVVVGGLRYVLSRGDPQATAKARGTILYAVIGLLIAVSAELIVSLVLDKL